MGDFKIDKDAMRKVLANLESTSSSLEKLSSSIPDDFSAGVGTPYISGILNDLLGSLIGVTVSLAAVNGGLEQTLKAYEEQDEQNGDRVALDAFKDK